MLVSAEITRAFPIMSFLGKGKREVHFNCKHNRQSLCVNACPAAGLMPVAWMQLFRYEETGRERKRRRSSMNPDQMKGVVLVVAVNCNSCKLNEKRFQN